MDYKAPPSRTASRRTGDPSNAWHAWAKSALEQRLGIKPDDVRFATTIAPYLSQCAERVGEQSGEAYLRRVIHSPNGQPEFDQLIDLVTIGETYFFRHEDQIRAISRDMRRIQALRPGPLAVWCAGCSTGEEPYTLALLLTELNIDGQIMATDLNPQSLATARQGASYSPRSVRRVPTDLRKKYFKGTSKGISVTPQLRSRVIFHQQNLAQDACPNPTGGRRRWDLILCRNVFIYFDQQTVESILTRFASALSECGSIWLAPTDMVLGFDFPLRRQRERGASCYGQGGRSEAFPNTTTETRSSAHSVPASPANDLDSIRHLLRRGLFSTAEAALEDYCFNNPRSAEAMTLAGHLSLRKLNYQKAVDLYSEALRADSSQMETWLAQGTALRKLGQLVPARDALNRALALEANCWPAALLLSGVLERLGESARAHELLLRCESLIGGSRDTYRASISGTFLGDLVPDPDESLMIVRQRLNQIDSDQGVVPIEAPSGSSNATI